MWCYNEVQRKSRSVTDEGTRCWIFPAGPRTPASIIDTPRHYERTLPNPSTWRTLRHSHSARVAHVQCPSVAVLALPRECGTPIRVGTCQVTTTTILACSPSTPATYLLAGLRTTTRVLLAWTRRRWHLIHRFGQFMYHQSVIQYSLSFPSHRAITRS